MSPSITISLLGLVAALCFGVADFFAARAAKTVGPIQSIISTSVIELPLFIIIYLIFKGHWIFNETAFIYALASGVFFSFAGVFFFKGLDKGPVSLVSPLGSMYPLFSTLIALLIFKAHLTATELAGIFLTLLGILATAGLLNVKKSERKITIGPRFALLTAVFWGLAFAMLAQAIERVGWLNASIVEIGSIALIMLLVTNLIKGNESVNLKTTAKTLFSKDIFLNGSITILAIVALNTGISRSLTTGGAVVIAISASYPIITILLALRHLNENISYAKLAGVVIGISGIVLLTL